MIAVSRCCGYQGLCHTQVTWRCRQRSPSSRRVSSVAYWTQWDGGLQGLGGTGDVPPLKEERSWLAGVCQDPETHCGFGMAAPWLGHGCWDIGTWSTERLRLGWASSAPLAVVVGSFIEPLDENVGQRWKAKVSSMLWVCDTTATQWTCPKKG